jgi:hypothetical protein
MKVGAVNLGLMAVLSIIHNVAGWKYVETLPPGTSERLRQRAAVS